MYRKILVPMDGSQRAEAIIPHVEELAHRYEAEILLLQVVSSDIIFNVPYHRPAQMELDTAFRRHEEEAKSYMAKQLTTFQEKGFTCRAFVEYGPVVNTIIDVAEREKVDLIAMASHGRSGLSRAFYGSVAAGVLHKINRPLLLIRAES